MASYEIVIKDQTGSGSGGGRGSAENPVANTDDNVALNPTADRLLKPTRPDRKAEYELLTHIALKRVGALYKQTVSHQASMVAVKTGRVELQQRYQVVVEGVSGVGSLASDIAMGASVAGAGGAAIAALLNIASTVINIAQKFEVVNAQRNLENTGIGLKSARSGGSLATYSQSRS